jgi:hypothetical protein
MCTAAVLITSGSTFFKSTGWQNQIFWEIITRLPATAVHLLVQKASNFSCLYKLKSMDI